MVQAIVRLRLERGPWEAKRFSASQENSPQFIEPEGSLLCSQEPITNPYLGQINPLHASSHFFKIHFNPLALERDIYSIAHLLTYLLHGAESFLRS